MAEKKKKKKFSLRKLIYNDKYLIIISILAAVIIWISTSMNLSPETTKTVTVPVTVDFSESAASQLGIKCFGDSSFDVDVTVSCKKYLAKDITADDINVSLQTNVVTGTGTVEVPVRVSTDEGADFVVQSYYPTSYKAFFDVEDEKELPIEISYNNRDFIEAGYIMGDPLLSEDTAVVKGPKTYVSQVSKIVSNVNIEEKLKATQSIDITATPVDSSGSSVNYITVDTESSNLTLTIPVLKQMELDVSNSFSGKPKKLNTSDFNITYSVNKVNAGVLEDANIKSANIGTIDFSKVKVGSNVFEFDVNSINGVIVLDNIDAITATVNVPSTYKSKNVNISKSSVKVANIPEGYKATVTSINSSSVTVIGTEDQLENISSSNVNLVVDLSSYKNNLKTGSSDYVITPSLENSDTCWIYGEYSAVLKIEKA
ncbi:MAG: YbbR-like domain-containing protein [Eubacterium sp.]